MYCPRCGRSQPSLPRGVYSCVYCSASLPVQRWRATVPPGATIGPAPRAIRRPYLGPPAYRGRHPGWGFPTVAWRPAERTEGVAAPAPPLRLLSWLVALAWATALMGLLAGAAETWRFVLVLRNRTLVLPDATARVSNALDSAAGWTLLAVGAVTAVVAAITITRAHATAADRLGAAPARTPAAVLARLVLPGWNLWGAGQMLAEVDGLLAQDPGAEVGRLRLSRLVATWWVAWIANAGFVLAALIRAFSRSPQAIADTVELHIWIDLAAAVVAGLLAALARRFHRRFSTDDDILAGWTVAAPAPTSERRPAKRAESAVQRKVSEADAPRMSESTAPIT